MSEAFESAYLATFRSGELRRRAETARRRLEECNLCGHACRVDRTESVEGSVCGTGERALVHSFGPHHGEEDPLRGWSGSGTIFFSGCNLSCLYCQNWEISQGGGGRELESEELAEIMLALQARGCHNVNFVSPSHVVAQILSAILLAAEGGLRIPLVFNSGGYDSPDALALLDGVIDIYMPDMKYGSSERGLRYSRVKDYVEINRAAVKEMHRQVGDLVLSSEGLARRGLLVRHLVLPGDLSNTERVLRFLATEISAETYLNLMDQYHPSYHAREHPPLDRRLTPEEYGSALEMAERAGLRRLDQRRRYRFH
jgi:putative pyruvate formate lyase activating enzyme